jgi:hypothetical protein
MDDLIEAVQRQADISNEQATLAIAAVLGFLTARLPSPLVGRIQGLLDNRDDRDRADRTE